MYRPIFFIHLFIDGHSVPLHVLAMDNAAMNKYLETLLSLFLDICLEVELLDHLVVLSLMLWGIAKLFSQQLHHFTFH